MLTNYSDNIACGNVDKNNTEETEIVFKKTVEQKLVRYGGGSL